MNDFIFRLKCAISILLNGGEDMVAMLWAQQIMLGQRAYAQVPRLLKEKVAEILQDSGMEELIDGD